MTTPGWDSSNHKIGPPGVAGTGGLGSQIDNFFKSLIAIPLKIAEFVFVEVPKLIIDTLTEFSEELFNSIFSFADWDNTKNAFENFKDGQKEINDRLDLIAPLLNYACVHLKEDADNYEVRGWRKLPFDERLGPIRGVEVYNGGLKLMEKGLWDIRCHLDWFHGSNWTFGDTVEAAIIIVKPGIENPQPFDEKGNVVNDQTYSALTNINDQISEITSAWTMSVVVKDPGYVAYVYARASSRRHIGGGPYRSRLVAQQISYTTATKVLESVKPLDPKSRE